MAADTTTTLPAPAPAGTGNGHASFRRLLVAEWTKMRTVRSTVWSLLALIILALGITTLATALTAANWSQAHPEQQANLIADPTSQILGSGIALSQLAICVLGVLVTAGEYSTGMIRSTLLASPHRLRTLAAKCVVFTILVLVLSEVIGFSCFFIGRAFLWSHAPVNLSDPEVLRSVVGFGLYLAMLGLFAVAIGQLIRHTAGAITTVIGLVLVIVPLAGLLPGNIGDHVSAYLPTNAGTLILSAVPQSDQLLTAWQGYGIFALWTVALLAVSGWLLVKRDA
jgi:ABC-2 type transport system permease protein